MNKDMLDTLNELSKKPATELALSYMEVVADNMEKDKEIERLNNIINSYENMKKELLDYIYHNEYCRFGHIDGGEADEMREIISKTDKLKELKEGK